MLISEKLPSRLNIIPEFILKVIDKIKPLCLQEEEIFNIKLSLHEALVNAIKHGNKQNPDLAVEVNISVQDNRLVMELRDKGEGFNFENIPDPTKNENLRHPTGRGIFLIRNLMDQVDFFDHGRGIKMIKLLNRAKGGRP
jgi:serine/threonine-protein kinase RsbW